MIKERLASFEEPTLTDEIRKRSNVDVGESEYFLERLRNKYGKTYMVITRKSPREKHYYSIEHDRNPKHAKLGAAHYAAMGGVTAATITLLLLFVK